MLSEEEKNASGCLVIAFIRDRYMLQAQTSTGAKREEFTRRAKMYDGFIQDVAKPVGGDE